MCGIFGFFGDVSSDTRAAAARAAVELMRHRGPDDHGTLDVGDGVLVSRRLAIVDLTAAGHQPMQSADGTLSLSFNGEIYNHAALREELRAHWTFRGHADTEVILAAYARWGDACLARFRGMFAFALWDAPKRRLLVATDRLSIKPVLFHASSSQLLVSSEVAPIAAAGVELKPNERRLFEYFDRGLLDHSEDTLFSGIQQLRPGTFLVYEHGRVRVGRYWDLDEARAGDAPWTDATLDEIDATLADAVDLHLGGDVEPALSLSGGLDSQVLLAYIQRGHKPHGLHAFTYCFPGTPYDECGRAQRAIGDSPVIWRGTPVAPDDVFARLDTLIGRMEGPVGGLGIYGYWMNCATVSASGYKVLLDGQGADEVFGGYRYYYSARFADLAARGETASLDRELAAFNAVHGTAIARGSAAFDTLLREADQTAVRAPDGTSLDSDYLAADFAARWRGVPPDPIPAPFRDPVKNARYRDLLYLKIPKLLRFQDRASMASSVEVRVPYLDHLVIEQLMCVPSDVLLAGGITKRLLRTLASSRLDIRHEEPKLYVATPQREWMKGPMRDATRDLMLASQLAEDGYIDARRLVGQFDAYCAAPALGNSFFAWKFLNLELWYRRFFRRPADARAAALSHHG